MFVLVGIVLSVDFLAPALLLVCFRRRMGEWSKAFLATLFITPFAEFFVTGGIAWITTYFQIVVAGNTWIADGDRMSVSSYLGFTFFLAGSYAVIFAGIGFAMSLPLLGLWRIVHRRSFNWVTAMSAAPEQSGSARATEVPHDPADR
jgi:hypothetical protein